MKERSMESLIITLVLWCFLGWLGAHRWYTGNTGSAMLMLLLNVVGMILTFAGVGLILLWIAGAWWTVDLFLILFGVLRKSR